VNYIEHYGMQRRLLPNGKYERVNPLHSWNASFLLTNFFLFQLQRHSDHHAYATREYQILRHFDESPQLPAGYPTMVLIALIPPLWFRIMNPLLEAWEKRVRQEPDAGSTSLATAS
jgi:alkane 1-monooxygenase